MITAAVYNKADGAIIGVYTAQASQTIFNQITEEMGLVLVPDGFDPGGKYVHNGEIADQTDLGSNRVTVLVGDTVVLPDLPNASSLPTEFNTSQEGSQIWPFNGEYKGDLTLEVISLAEARTRANTIVRDRMVTKLRGGFVCPNIGTIHTGVHHGIDSLLLIQGAFSSALLAQLNNDTSWEMGWNLEDGTPITLDIGSMLTVGDEVAKFVRQLYAWERTTVAAIATATTLSDINTLAQSSFD